jgi:tetratricopeptide (TPR) repeat protein
MLNIDDDKFRILCENLDENSLKEDLPKIMKNSLETIEKEIDSRTQNIELDEKNHETYDIHDSKELLELAFFYMDRGDIEQGIEYFQENISKNKNSSETYLYLSDAYVISSDFDMAKKILADGVDNINDNPLLNETFKNRIMAIDMKSGDEYYKREIFCEYYLIEAMNLFDKEKYTEAANYYMHALRIIPGDYESMIKLGCCFWRMDDKVSAIRFFHQSLIIMEMPVLVTK